MAKKTKAELAGGKSNRGLDLEEIERVLQFMDKHRLEQLEYERDGVRILLKKAPARVPAQARIEDEFAVPPRGFVEEPVAVPVAGTQPAAAPAVSQSAEEGLHVVKSPIVGTFYSSPSPDAEPFVSVGSRVQAGQVLCIIEAMKLMNEIEADASGQIAKIFVENGHPVEYGERLFGIRTDSKG